MKIYQRNTFFICGLTVLPSAGWAQNMFEAGIGPAIADFTYNESSVQDNGTLYGIQGYLALYDQWMKRVEGSYLQGKIDYTSDSTGSMSDISDYIFEIRGLIGPNLSVSGTEQFTPYSGLGYRYLNDDSAYRQTTTGHWGYEREQSYLYLPLGVLVKLTNGELSITGQFEYDYLMEGHNHSYLSTVPGYPDISVTQHDGYGLRASLTFSRPVAIGSISALSFSPYIKYWSIQNSSVDSGYYEPKNDSTEFGAVVNANF
jgi:hypothetical protein